MPQRDPVEFAAENAYVLDLVHAMVGWISPNMRAVSVELAGRGIRLHVLLAEDDEADREAIEDIVFEFDVLQVHDVEVEVIVAVSSEPLAMSSLPGRRIFGRRED